MVSLNKKIVVSLILLMIVVQCKETSSSNSGLTSLLNPDLFKISLDYNETCIPSDLNPINYSNDVSLFNKVTEAPGATFCGFGDPRNAINGVRGAGKTSGSLDVYSLRSSSYSVYCRPDERCIVLEITNKKVTNGDGIDFVIFENAFCYIGESNWGISHFMEPIIVEVSSDGINWCGWNPQYTGSDTSATNLRNPNNWQRFAGTWPVIYNQDNWTFTENDIFDINKAGGNGFDLSHPEFGNSGYGCTSSVKSQILTTGFIYLRLTSARSRGLMYDPNSLDQTPDIDGVIARYVQNR